MAFHHRHIDSTGRTSISRRDKLGMAVWVLGSQVPGLPLGTRVIKDFKEDRSLIKLIS